MHLRTTRQRCDASASVAGRNYLLLNEQLTLFRLFTCFYRSYRTGIE